jgi:N-acetylmuramoyl-L-alanine amidase
LILGFNLLAQTNIVSNKIETVVIDAGHGGKDPGALGKTSKEKDLTLAIALKTGNFILSQNPNIKVIYTRKDDNFVELYERANIANKAKADLFISIHANSNAKKDVNGSEFWVLGLHRADENLEVAKKENAVVSLENNVEGNYGFDPNSPEGNIIMTMKQSLYLDKSIQFAKSIEKNYSFESNQINRGTKQAGFVVLYKTAMPSVLVEVGFISNAEEEAFLSSDEGQNEIAMKIANAFADYKLKYESKAVRLGEKGMTKTPNPKSSNPASTNTYNQTGTQHAESNHDAEPSSTNTTLAAVTPPVKRQLINLAPEDAPIIDSKQAQSVKNTPPVKKMSDIKAPDKTQKDVKSEPNSSSLINNTDKRVVILDEDMRDETLNNEKPSAAVKTPDKMVENIAPKATSKSVAEKELQPSSKQPQYKKSDPNLPAFEKNEDVKKAILENAKEVETKQVAPKPLINKLPDAAQRPKQVSTEKEGLIYRVQVKASSNRIQSDDPLYELSLNVAESLEDGLYKYMIGEFSSHDAAKVKQLELKAAGVKDAFIVKYMNGLRIK